MKQTAFVTIVILSCFSAKAQQDSLASIPLQKIDDVVITGQYTPNAKENAVQKIEIVDRKKIDAMAAQTLRDVLTNQLNIRLSQDAIFGSGMSIQGSQSYGESAKILVDGVSMIGKQNGSIDLSQINLDNIERIEIIEGPMSVSYGTDAIAGTINLVTKKKLQHPFEGSISTYYESIGTYNINASAGLRKNKHTLLLNTGRNFFDGWKPGEKASFFDFKKELADTNRSLQWKPREQYSAGLQYIYTANKTSINYKGNYFYETITNRGTPLLPYYEMAFDDYYHTRRIDNAIFVNQTLANDKHINFQLAYNDYKRVKDQYTRDLTTLTDVLTPGEQDTSKYDEISSRATFSNSSKQAKINYEAGYDISVQHANSNLILNQKQQMGNYAVFASLEYKPFSKFVIRPGLRYGYNTRYTAPLIPSLNLLYKPGNQWALRASYAKGFREPNLKELYFDFVDINHDIHGNRNLKAEYSNDYSFSAVYGGNYQELSYKINFSAFYNHIISLITLAAITGTGTNEYTYVNIGKYKTQGLQLGADLSIKSLSVSAGGSYTGTYNQLSETTATPRFSYSPEIRSSVTYNMSKYGITASVYYKYTGRFTTYITDASNNAAQAFTGDYHIADANLSKQLFKKHLNISIGCKNLFDVKNITAYATGTAHSSSSGSTPIGTGRFYFVKLDVKFY